MHDFDLPPKPAFAMPAESLSAMMSQAHTIAKEINDSEKSCLSYALTLGEILNKTRDMVKHGSWGDWLEKISVSSSSALEYMALAKFPARREFDGMSIRGALRYMADHPPRPDDSPPPSPPKQLFCPDCQRKGPMKNCQKCEALRATAAKAKAKADAKSKPPDDPPPDREPGDDTESEAEAEAKNKKDRKEQGQPIFDKKRFDQSFGALVQTIDTVGKAYKVKEAPEAQALRDKLKEFLTEFKAWMKTVSKPKE